MAVDLMVLDPDLGDLYVVNGVDAPRRWDGLADQFEPAGMDAPASAPVVSGSGVGAIVGTYYAYLRFADAIGNFSNLSPVSNEYTAAGLTGTITDVTSATPIVVTSAAHGLVTGAWVKITGVGGVDTANNTWQITVMTADTFSLDDSDSDGISSYTGGGTWISGVSAIVYTSVAVPTEAKVVRRQLLRNTDGQAEVFYVDVDTTDLTSTTLSSTLTDTLLGAGVAQPLLDSQGLPLANGNAKPPNFFKCIAQQLDRMFLAGLLEYTKGSASVANGSPTVTGAGTNWKATMAGRFLYVDGASRTYEISSVSETAQTLTLTDNYNDPTNLFAFYSIKAPPAYRRVVQFSQAGLPQSWPAHNAFSLQETGDEITGLFQMGPYLYISERAHLHKFTFANNPLTDGAVFMAAYRGAVNQRCIVLVDESAFMLDELGIHRFAGQRQGDAQSGNIQAMFRTDEDVIHRINWHWKEFFHASLDRQREIIRFFVSLDGNRYPRHCLALQYRTQRWWVEEFPTCIGGTCAGYNGGFAGLPQIFYGCQHNAIFAANVGSTDGPAADAGESRSTATASSWLSLTDSQQQWPTSGVVNSQLAIVSGAGKGQRRRITAVSGNILQISMPWEKNPDATSVYQIGGIRWQYRSSWLRLSPSEYTQPARWEMLFEPLLDDATATLRFFVDFDGSAEEQATTVTAANGNGIAATKGSADMVIDLSRPNGQVDMQRPHGKEYFIRGNRYVQYELEGTTHKDQQHVFGFQYDGVFPQEGGQ